MAVAVAVVMAVVVAVVVAVALAVAVVVESDYSPSGSEQQNHLLHTNTYL